MFSGCDVGRKMDAKRAAEERARHFCNCWAGKNNRNNSNNNHDSTSKIICCPKTFCPLGSGDDCILLFISV
jgi:hypothetical protein